MIRSRSVKKITFLALFAFVMVGLGGPGVAAAQKEEPTPPGAEDGEKPGSRGASLSRSGDPATSAPSDDGKPVPLKKFDPNDWKHAMGAYVRYLFVTELMLKPYLEAATPLNSFSVGLQYIHRFSKFDVVTSLDFSWLVLNDGNWLAKDNNPALDTKYVQFDKLSFLSADVAIIGHHAFNNWLEIRGGAGLGLGVVFGNVYTTNNSQTVCNKDNAGDTSKCYPVVNGGDPNTANHQPIYLNQADTEQKLKATEDSSREDTAQNPHRKNSNKPPVMAVLNIMMALNFRVHKHVSTSIELGFRDAMFVGAGMNYHF
jgi:hypothetical protein